MPGRRPVAASTPRTRRDSPFPAAPSAPSRSCVEFVDEAGARRRGYIRLMTDTPALAAPDQAVVAAFERVDLMIVDPMGEIVAGRVDPDRGLADHAYAQRLLARAGTRAIIPAGPLVVAQDLETGMPSDPATRAGRAMALQLLAVSLARRGGMPAEWVVVDALPTWIVDEPDAPARAAAEVALRRVLLPDHALAFIEPALDARAAATWHAVMAALLPDAGDVEVVVRRPGSGGPAGSTGIAGTLEAAGVAVNLRGSRGTPELLGAALEHAGRAVDAAASTLAALADHGWSALVDEPLGIPAARLGADAVAERTEAFDPLATWEPRTR